MYNKACGYRSLPQRDSVPAKPGLFVATESFVQSPFHHHTGQGLSFDYIPNVRDNDYRDSTQGWLSWICNVIVCFMVYICTFITFPISGWFVLKVVPNYQRVVVFRLGRVRPPKGPGVVLVLPLIDQWQRVDLRTRAFNIPPCQVTTRDGGVVSVGADIQFRIWSPVMSVVSVQDLNASTRLTAHNAMTTSLGRKSVREIQTERIKLGEYLGMDINETTKPWGLEVDRVELTVGAVLKPPEDCPSGPGSVILPPSIPGLEGLAGPIQQLAMHFLGNMAGGNNGSPLVRTEDSISFSDEVSSTPLAISRTGGGDEAVTGPVSVLGLMDGLLLSESLVSQVGACFLFLLQSPDGQQTSYYVDLSQGSGSAGPGSPPEGLVPDVTFSMTDQDLLAMFEGTLRPFAAYTTGRLKVQGDLKTAMKLEEVIKLLRP
ncbi:stomatin-like protein 1 [Salmo salar]|uniref:Stomatin-like protein 1 n=1 Tax=Salmo salar TaxID=8030 RepID=A0ABM3DU01_SALSA|nr:stomatin-like protein 1 [Salmo salar]XP_045562287.1 stomatin-like protein 1 [Salmo salar]XP_045562288.1 stomatin-like protein 1 [Salmo salar]